MLIRVLDTCKCCTVSLRIDFCTDAYCPATGDALVHPKYSDRAMCEIPNGKRRLRLPLKMGTKSDDANINKVLFKVVMRAEAYCL